MEAWDKNKSIIDQDLEQTRYLAKEPFKLP